MAQPKKDKEENIIQIKDDDDFEKKLKEYGKKLLILDFGASWCGPCKLLDGVIKEIAKKYPNAIFLKIDVDECEEAAENYCIKSMPTLVFLKDGKETDRQEGAGKPEDVKKKVKTHCDS